MKSFSKTLQNLPYCWNMKSQEFFCSSLRAYFFPNECPGLCWHRLGHSLGEKNSYRNQLANLLLSKKKQKNIYIWTWTCYIAQKKIENNLENCFWLFHAENANAYLIIYQNSFITTTEKTFRKFSFQIHSCSRSISNKFENKNESKKFGRFKHVCSARTFLFKVDAYAF